MKKSLFSIFLIAFVLSCTQNGNKTSYDNQVKKDVLESAIKYAMSKYKVSKETVAQDGTIIVTDNQTNFVIAHSNRWVKPTAPEYNKKCSQDDPQQI